jgi:hypothetical protein
MEGKAIMPGKVQKLGIEGDLRGSLEDHAFEVVIPMAVGHPADFLKGSQVAVQEELQGMAGIELEKQIPGVGQKVHESVEDPGGDPPLHPVDLGLFSGQEGELMKPLGLSLAQGARIPFDRSIAPRESVGS